MCLSSVQKYYDKDDDKEGYGYKVVFRYNDKFQFYYFRRPKKCSFNKWLRREKVTPIYSDDRKQYLSGFHVYTSKYAAKRAQLYTSGNIVKVLYKGRVCKGKQFNFYDETNCLVVKQIMILDDIIQ